MRIVYTDEALANLDETLQYITSHYPAVHALFERRLRLIEARICAWPESARKVAERPDVRVVPFIRYPYKLFYRIENDRIEILHIHHAARRAPWAEDNEDASGPRAAEDE